MSSGFCSRGYRGVLCNECEEGYGHLNKQICVPCTSASYISKTFFGLVIRVMLNIFSLYTAT